METANRVHMQLLTTFRSQIFILEQSDSQTAYRVSCALHPVWLFCLYVTLLFLLVLTFLTRFAMTLRERLCTLETKVKVFRRIVFICRLFVAEMT